MAGENKDSTGLLFEKYLEGKINSAEKSEFYKFLSDSANEDVVKDILFRQLSDFNEEPPYYNKTVDFETIYGNVMFEIRQNEIKQEESLDFMRRTRIRKITIYSSCLAAVFVFALLIGRYLLPFRSNITSTPDVISYNEIRAPYGSRSEVRLPDGTEVKLNAGSIIKYRSDFNTSNRELDLTGEAYFNVAKNEKIPLIVSAGSINVKAVGTEFNIKAYNEEGTIETTLITGKVEITRDGPIEEGDKFVDLVPNQKAIFIKDEDSFILEKIVYRDSISAPPVKTIYENILISPKVNVEQVVAWTQGKLILRGENLDNLCVELERKYDVKIVFINEEIKKYRFSGILLDETLEQVLSVIKLTSPISYSLDGKTVYLNSDTKVLNDFSKHMK